MKIPHRQAQHLQPGDVIFGDEMVWGVMLGQATALGQNVMVMTDKDTFQMLENELV